MMVLKSDLYKLVNNMPFNVQPQSQTLYKL